MTDTTARLAELEGQLAQLLTLLPEHCSGHDTYMDGHHASVAHWQKIEELEDEIKALKAAAAG